MLRTIWPCASICPRAATSEHAWVVLEPVRARPFRCARHPATVLSLASVSARATITPVEMRRLSTHREGSASMTHTSPSTIAGSTYSRAGAPAGAMLGTATPEPGWLCPRFVGRATVHRPPLSSVCLGRISWRHETGRALDCASERRRITLATQRRTIARTGAPASDRSRLGIHADSSCSRTTADFAHAWPSAPASNEAFPRRCMSVRPGALPESQRTLHAALSAYPSSAAAP